MTATNEELLIIINMPAQSQAWADYWNSARIALWERGYEIEEIGTSDMGYPVYQLKSRSIHGESDGIQVGDKVSYDLNGHEHTGYVLRPARRDPSYFEVSDINSSNNQVYVFKPDSLTKERIPS